MRRWPPVQPVIIGRLHGGSAASGPQHRSGARRRIARGPSEATCSIASGVTCSTIRYPRRHLVRFGRRRPARARPGARLAVDAAGQARGAMGSVVFAIRAPHFRLRALLHVQGRYGPFCSTVGPMLLCARRGR